MLARTYANDDEHSPIVLAAFKEISDTLEYEKNVGETLSPLQILKTPVARRRVAIGISCSVFSVIIGNVIASYYIGQSGTSRS